MNRVDRAKQFLPFDALKGLQEELRKREEKFLWEDRRVLSEERLAEINEILCGIKGGDEIFVEYYNNGKYLKISGVCKIIKNIKQLKISDIIINFKDIYDIFVTHKHIDDNLVD